MPTPRSWPGDEGLTPRYARWALWLIIVLALSLRLWGIRFGMPYDFTPDEVHEIMRALKLGAGEYDWDHFGKGGLFLLLFVEYGALYAFWWLTGHVDSPTEFALQYLLDPTAFYLLGRVTVAIMGALTCLVVYHIGSRVHGWRVGLAAALIGATAHFHAEWSHYINVDIGMTLAVWTSILAFLHYEKTNRTKWLAAAGALAGVAVAFKLPGIVVLIPLGLALVTPGEKWSEPLRLLKTGAIGLVTMAIALVVVAPESLPGIRALGWSFAGILGGPAPAAPVPSEVEIGRAIQEITVMTFGDYLQILTAPAYLALTVGALIGGIIGCFKRNRWDIIWCVLTTAFLLVMYAADRPGSDRYLLPIMPALWLLAARAAVAVSGTKPGITLALIAAIVAVPLFSISKQNYMFTRPDTRVLAKSWIEANAPAGSKILMDGMRYRYIQSPPLNPDEATVRRRIAIAEKEGANLSRGVSSKTLTLYAEAMARVTGPRYELHSTVYGLEVQDLSYYPEACFHYIVTSSANSARFNDTRVAHRYPRSARFYRDLPNDSRFELVYSAEPVDWKIRGPKIAVYRVLESCG